ncbi:MAG: hypothetical protein M5U28_25925 [Sandaracinaceae bacterium]|nr:hypothetical protein [Sandaracinaceae bacterium]
MHGPEVPVLRSVSLLLVLMIPSALSAQPARRVRPSERVELTLEDGDLGDLIRLMTRVTGHRYLVTGAPRQIRVTISSSEPVTAAEAYRAFLAILHQNGMTVIERGGYHLVVDTGQIPRRTTRVHGDGDAPPGDDRFVTWIHRVAHMPLEEAAAVIDPLRSAEGQIVTHPPTRTLIVVDTGANIARLSRVLADLDVPGGDVHMWVEPLHHADATQAAEQVRALFLDEAPAPARRAAAGERQAAAEPVAIAGELRRVVPEPRTNQLVIVGTEAGYRRVLAFLRVIDRRRGRGLHGARPSAPARRRRGRGRHALAAPLRPGGRERGRGPRGSLLARRGAAARRPQRGRHHRERVRLSPGAAAGPRARRAAAAGLPRDGAHGALHRSRPAARRQRALGRRGAPRSEPPSAS